MKSKTKNMKQTALSLSPGCLSHSHSASALLFCLAGLHLVLGFLACHFQILSEFGKRKLFFPRGNSCGNVDFCKP